MIHWRDVILAVEAAVARSTQEGKSGCLNTHCPYPSWCLLQGEQTALSIAEVDEEEENHEIIVFCSWLVRECNELRASGPGPGSQMRHGISAKMHSNSGHATRVTCFFLNTLSVRKVEEGSSVHRDLGSSASSLRTSHCTEWSNLVFQALANSQCLQTGVFQSTEFEYVVFKPLQAIFSSAPRQPHRQASHKLLDIDLLFCTDQPLRAAPGWRSSRLQPSALLSEFCHLSMGLCGLWLTLTPLRHVLNQSRSVVLSMGPQVGGRAIERGSMTMARTDGRYCMGRRFREGLAHFTWRGKVHHVATGVLKAVCSFTNGMNTTIAISEPATELRALRTRVDQLEQRVIYSLEMDFHESTGRRAQGLRLDMDRQIEVLKRRLTLLLEYANVEASQLERGLLDAQIRWSQSHQPVTGELTCSTPKQHALGGFVEETHCTSGRKGRSAGIRACVTSPQKKMGVEEWVRYRIVEAFEKQGMGGIQGLEGKAEGGKSQVAGSPQKKPGKDVAILPLHLPRGQTQDEKNLASIEDVKGSPYHSRPAARSILHQKLTLYKWPPNPQFPRSVVDTQTTTSMLNAKSPIPPSEPDSVRCRSPLYSVHTF
ncbi:uncharacterized protein MYCFIDRAFT_180467 [Pseudocercospora fijiensis CIRAD86]|uniref:Uncharacterized protein n=1 Tax=Pseudocercospora fijiensis (strain CIRAD86) TaxID=383855 RepID=M2ZXY8_PSEFD|nr:uncharacterized protein MYCFIDRAFT_180467 [Pseudocercospora fijiensis CIRAD86]EME76981.1 hypothetical protein MYCFIDRAFT_180467 [Pseudocercospora fijiensis CIRAD86]